MAKLAQPASHEVDDATACTDTVRTTPNLNSYLLGGRASARPGDSSRYVKAMENQN